MKPLSFLLAAAALLLVGCSRDAGHTDAAVPPSMAALPPEPTALAPAPPSTPSSTPAKAAAPDPEPSPQEVAAFNARVPK